jgi:SAM-dependent methyltransferase
MTLPPNSAQIDFWNGQAGQKWAALWSRIDVMLAEVSRTILDALGSVAGKRILDIGCGTGATCRPGLTHQPGAAATHQGHQAHQVWSADYRIDIETDSTLQMLDRPQHASYIGLRSSDGTYSQSIMFAVVSGGWARTPL